MFCEHGTREKCYSTNGNGDICGNVHFKKIIMPHTDESLGNCSYLDTCRHMEYCKFVHYKIDEIDEFANPDLLAVKNKSNEQGDENLAPMQWINWDLRSFDFSILNDCNVLMLDPPWDIHMNLPYGTLKDKEMKNLRIDLL